MRDLLEMTGQEGAPEVKEQEFHGGKTRYGDRFGLRVVDGHQGIGIGSTFAVTVFNPNRGAPYFQINDEKDLAALKKSFDDAWQQVGDALKEHEKRYRAWSKERFDREMGGK